MGAARYDQLNSLCRNEWGMGPIKTIFTVLLVALLGIGGWLAYRFFVQSVGLVNIPITAPSQSVIPPIKAYTDPAGVYSLTYPRGWAMNAQSTINESIPLPIIDNKILNFIPPAPADSGFGIAGLFNVVAFQATPAAVLAGAKHGTNQTAAQSLTINGYQALYQQDSNNVGLTFTDDEYAVYHNGVTLYFTMREKQGATQDVTPFDETAEVPVYVGIVKSVKFLN